MKVIPGALKALSPTQQVHLWVWASTPVYLLVLYVFTVGSPQYIIGLICTRLPALTIGAYIAIRRKDTYSRAIVWILGAETIFMVGRATSVYYETGSTIPQTIWILAYGALLIGVHQVSQHWASGRSLSVFQDTAMICLAWLVISADALGIKYFMTAFHPGLSVGERTAQLMASSYQIFDIIALGMCVRIALLMVARDGRALWLLAGVSTLAAGDMMWQIPSVHNATSHIAVVSDLLYHIHAGAFILAAALPDASRPASSPRRAINAHLHYREGALLTLCLAVPSVSVMIMGVSVAHNNTPVALYGGAVLALVAGWRVHSLFRMTCTDAEDFFARATHDPLTGCLNRAGWDAAMAMASTVKSSRAFAYHVVILDLDHFKEFNDTYGHQAGDALLAEAVANWHRELPDDCILARLGGEEFAVFVPKLTAQQTAALTGRLLSSVPHGRTCSAGIAGGRIIDNPEAVIRRADQALYTAKRRGRNRAEIHGASNPVQPDSTTTRRPGSQNRGAPKAQHVLSPDEAMTSNAGPTSGEHHCEPESHR